MEKWGTLVVVRIAAHHVILWGSGSPPTRDNTGQLGAFQGMSANSDRLAVKTRLDSWKEIAAFFGRDERTVKRWEKERGLPVYRVPGSARGGVFAYAEELTQWMEGTEQSHPQAAGIASAEDRSADTPSPLVALNSKQDSTNQVVAGSRARLGWSRFLPWLVPLLIVGTVVIVFSAWHRATSIKKTLAAAHVPSAGWRIATICCANSA